MVWQRGLIKRTNEEVWIFTLPKSMGILAAYLPQYITRDGFKIKRDEVKLYNEFAEEEGN